MRQERSWADNPWTKEEILKLIAERDDFAVRCLMKLYERQTVEEQMSGTTKFFNHQGFSGVDAEILTSFAEQFRRHRILSKKQIIWMKARIVKYTRQLLEVANGGEKPKRRQVR